MVRPSRQSLLDSPLPRARSSFRREFPVLLLLLSCLLIPATASADQYEYDAAGRLYRVTHHTGRVTTYSYDNNGNVLAVTVSVSPTGVEEEGSVPLAFSLGRAWPNPGQSSHFTFTLPHKARVTVRVFDIAGRLAGTVADGEFGPGLHQVELSPGRWAAGVYFYRLDTPGFSKTQRFVHLK
jgi:YD repeat-containing protein